MAVAAYGVQCVCGDMAHAEGVMRFWIKAHSVYDVDTPQSFAGRKRAATGCCMLRVK